MDEANPRRRWRLRLFAIVYKPATEEYEEPQFNGPG